MRVQLGASLQIEGRRGIMLLLEEYDDCDIRAGLEMLGLINLLKWCRMNGRGTIVQNRVVEGGDQSLSALDRWITINFDFNNIMRLFLYLILAVVLLLVLDFMTRTIAHLPRQ